MRLAVLYEDLRIEVYGIAEPKKMTALDHLGAGAATFASLGREALLSVLTPLSVQADTFSIYSLPRLYHPACKTFKLAGPAQEPENHLGCGAFCQVTVEQLGEFQVPPPLWSRNKGALPSNIFVDYFVFLYE